MANIYNGLGLSGKNYLDKSKKLDEARAEYAAQKKASLEESLQEEEARRKAEFYAAGNTYAMPRTRARDRLHALQEAMQYNANAPIIGMTEMVSQVVEKALLLDESELATIYPEYKDDIREMVKGYLKNAPINESITNKDTLALMEHVSKLIPPVEDGKYLTEDELLTLFKSSRVHDVDGALKNLGGNVSSRVATLMEKEQARVNKINKDVESADKKKSSKNPEVLDTDTVLKMLEKEEISIEDLDNMLKDGAITQDTYDEIINELDAASNEVAPEEEVVPDAKQQPAAEEAPVENVPAAEQEIPAEETQSTMVPKKQITMAPDGSISVNIYENLIKETPRSGLIESLAVNEAMNQLKEGKEYNSDYCLAKSILYVTITEAMDEMGLMDIDENAYRKITAAAGGAINENKLVKMSVPKKKDSVQCEKACNKKMVMTESYMNTQWRPITNNIQTAGADLAERIRQKKLLKESTQNLSE